MTILGNLFCTSLDTVGSTGRKPTLVQPRENTQLTSDSVSDKDDINDGDHPIQQEQKMFPTLLKLISGTLVGGADFSEIYIDIGDEDKVNSCSENNNMEGKGENTNKRNTGPKTHS